MKIQKKFSMQVLASKRDITKINRYLETYYRDYIDRVHLLKTNAGRAAVILECSNLPQNALRKIAEYLSHGDKKLFVGICDVTDFLSDQIERHVFIADDVPADERDFCHYKAGSSPGRLDVFTETGCGEIVSPYENEDDEWTSCPFCGYPIKYHV